MHDLTDVLSALPADLQRRSGSVFYSGAAAFAGKSPVYVLGLNPGGNPLTQSAETIERDIEQWRDRPAVWSRYLDESWRGNPAGTHGIQPRLVHLLCNLDLDPRLVPASNVVFMRTANEADLKREAKTLLPACWPFHNAVISNLEIRTLLCLGNTAGKWARKMLSANIPFGQWSERNERRWKATAYLSSEDIAVVTLPHPSRADWRNPLSDPSEFVRDILRR